MSENSRYYDHQRLEQAGITGFDYDLGLWWYSTPEERMACPPFVQTADDLERFFRGTAREFDLAKRPKAASVKRNSGHPACRPVEALDPDTGKVVATYPSVNAAADAVGCKSCTISTATRQHRPIKGYLWRRAKRNP